MKRFRMSCTALLLGSSFVGSSPLPAQSTLRLGGEFQVNAFTVDYQTAPAVALDADGDFIVVWTSYDQDGNYGGIFARRFNAAGVPQAAEFQVNTFTIDGQSRPAVARDTDGDFVVVWQSFAQEGAAYGIFARRFNAAGVPQAVEFQVNTYTTSTQTYPAVAIEADGDFVVAWQSAQDGSSYGIFARRFNAAGVPQASELQVNLFTPSHQRLPAVDMDDGGDFVVAWQSYGHDGSSDGVFARRFDTAGAPQASEFQVNARTAGIQANPAVGLDAAGDFVVAWQSFAQDGSLSGIFGRRFDRAGEPQAFEFLVNTHTTNVQDAPAVAVDADGDFVVSWRSLGQEGTSYGIFARHFDALGTPQAVEFQVNTYTPNTQAYPAVAFDAAGDFVVVWRSFLQDGSDYGVFAQRFATLAILDIDGNGATAALTDGLLILRFLFGFTGATLVNGAVDGGGCTRCDAATIEAYLETLV